MAAADDRGYAMVLIGLLQEDLTKSQMAPNWISVALWMAEEVRRQASQLRIPPELSQEMIQLADSVRRTLRETPRRKSA